MNTQTDQQLLRDYAGKRSEAAFSELVRRHIDLVYSAALRMVCSPQEAQDVTQGVFVALAQNATRLTGHTALSGWLHRTAQNLASNAVRASVRRQTREQEAVVMNELHAAPADTSWEKVAPHLDAALGEMNEPDRDALLLRYFEGKSAREMATILGVTDVAAQKRVNRAVERLREFLTQRGVTVGAIGLVAGISANAVQGAPAGLAASVSGIALAGAAATTSTLITAAQTIAMTTSQKLAIAAVVVALAGTGIYEARQVSQLRDRNRVLQEQLEVATAQKLEMEQLKAATPVVVLPGKNLAATQQNIDTDWPARLLSLNAKDWRQAFSLGQELATLPPNLGLAILRTNWASVTNSSARQQLLKAFAFAQHERLPAVLELGVLDGTPAVQNWALNYLKETSLQDFTVNIAAGKEWLAARRDWTLSAAFADAVWQSANTLRSLEGDQLHNQLALLKNATPLFSQCKDAGALASLYQRLGEIASSGAPQPTQWALEAAGSMPVNDEWRREVALPRLAADNSWAVRGAAARVLGKPGSDWAVSPLLDALSQSVYSEESHSVWPLAQPLAEAGSAKAIPTMIALIEAENTYETIYGIGYFGLGKLTGVTYDKKHDGAWWRQWWDANKQRFPADVQSLEVPRLNPLKKTESATTR